MKKVIVISLLVLIAMSLAPAAIAQDDGYTIAFVPGVNPDPFYITMSAASIRRRKTWA